MLIPNERYIKPRLQISRNDGIDWTDITDYLQRINIDLGDTSGIGVNASGTDGVLRTASFTLHNNIDSNFNPAVKTSSWNLVSGSWSPLLWPYRRAKFETSIYDTKIEVKNEMIGIGNDSDTEFYTGQSPLVNGITGISLYTASDTWWDDTTTSWDNNTDDWDQLGKIADVADIDYTVDNETGKITFASPPGAGVNIQVESYHYWKNNSGFIPVFEGYLGESIKCGDYSVTCQVLDLGKRLQDCYIETETQYGSVGGDPAETVIQSIIDDNLGSGIVYLYTPISPGFAILNTSAAKIGYCSIWDAIQKIAGMFGWFIGYKLDWNTSTFRLTLMEPPRLKTHSLRDFELDHNDDFYSQTLEISDRDIRNKWTVTFKNQATGLRESVTVKDDDSIAQFTLKAAQIEQGDADLIDTTAEASDLANAALSDTKYATGLTRIDMPYLHNMDIFSGIIIHHPKLSSTIDFYGVQSISHELDWTNSQQKFRTYITGIGQVVGKSIGWQHIMSRTWVNPPIEGLDIRTETVESDRLAADVREKTNNSPERQTVIWANEPSNLLTSNGLNINLGPCIISFANGFDTDGSAKNILYYNPSTISAWTIPTSKRVFLYIDYATDNTVSFGYTKIPPQYENSFSATKNVLLDFEGPNGSTTINDKFGNSVVCYGNAQISTAQYKYGTSSLICDGTNDYVEIDSIIDLDGVPWMVSGWFRWTTLPASGANSLVFGSTNHYSFWLALNNTGGTRKLSLSLSSNGSSYDIASANLGTKTDWIVDTWYYITLAFDGSNFNVYVDGNLDKTISSSLPIYSCGGIRLGADWNIASDFTGYIDDFEFIGRNYVYADTFTPPTETPTENIHWFNMLSKQMQYGDPSEWLTKYRVFIGDVIASSTAVTEINIYALNNETIIETIYELGVNQIQRTPHNLGKKPIEVISSLYCIASENGYIPGDEVREFPNYYDGTYTRTYAITDDYYNIISNTDANALVIESKITGGDNPPITMSNWKFRFHCKTKI